MELRTVTDRVKKADDPVLLAVLAKQGVNNNGVELALDYAPRRRGKACSPYGKLYRDLNSGRRFLVCSGLPMVDAYGQKHELTWRDKNGVIENGNNIFHAVVKKDRIRLVVLSGQPYGVRKDEEMIFHPQLFINGGEVKPSHILPRLLETDPDNENYHHNVLEWDYGICKRRIRVIEGRFLGSWVFTQKPSGDVRIKYNRSGSLRLKLGRFGISGDEEFVPAAYFEKSSSVCPVTVSDSAAFYPDADPESVSCDGWVRRYSPGTWAQVRDGAGTQVADNSLGYDVIVEATPVTNQFDLISRLLFFFDTAALGAGANITAAALSLYGYEKANTWASPPSGNIFGCTSSGTTSLNLADYGNCLSVPFSGSIPYASWNTSGYNEFIFNPNGIAAIDKAGISRFSFREASYDAPDIAPVWAAFKCGYLGSYLSDKGSGYKPVLVVTYTVGETKLSGDGGGGSEAVGARSQESGEQGTGIENSSVEALVISGDAGAGNETGSGPESIAGTLSAADEGSGGDKLNFLIQQAGADLKLQGHQGQVEMPHKEVSL